METSSGNIFSVAPSVDATENRRFIRTTEDLGQVFGALFTNAPVGIFQTDAQGNCITSPQRTSGFPRGAVSRRNFTMVLHPDDREWVAKSWKSSMNNGVQWCGEYRYLCEDGNVIWIQGTSLALRDGRGTVVGYLGCNTDITERKMGEVILAAKEERLRMALEASGDGVWDFDPCADKWYFTHACFRMLGYPGAESGSNEDWFAFVHQEDLGRLRAMHQDCIDNSIPSFELEFRVKTKGGGWKWIFSRGKGFGRDREGKARRLIGTFTDISERKNMEEMLRMEHNLLDLITSTSPVGIMFLDQSGEIAFANPRTEQIFGLPKEMIVEFGLTAPEWNPRSCGKIFGKKEQSIRQVLESGEHIVNACFTFQRPDGERVLLSMNAAPFLDSAGQIGGTVATFEDVTDRKLNEQALADSAWLLRETQRIAQLGTYVLDGSFENWRTSSKLDEILGIDPDFSRNLKGYLQIIHPDFRTQYIDSYISAVTNAHQFEMEYKIVRPSDGGERWVAEFCEMSYDEDGNVSRLIGTVQDITERKAAEEAIRNLNDDLDRRVVERTSQLNAAKQEMESFSYSVSHDLRAPLRHINSYSAMLVDEFGKALPREAQRYLERICAASSRMGKLIDDLLLLSRVSRAQMKRDRFSISSVATEVVEMLRMTYPERELSFVIPPGLSAKGDSELVRLVLENLMQNAVKYSSKKSRARIEFGKSVREGKAVFFVKDDGVGFDMAYSDKLFQPFQRLHGGEFEGTGIGLATVRRIVERHGGNVWAEGVEGEGATFFFTLPDRPSA